MANALYALDAVVKIKSADDSERTIPIGDFHRLPGDTPEKDNNLQHGELIVAIELPDSNFAKHSYYLKVRDRASYAFALVAVAAAIEMQGDTFATPGLCLAELPISHGAAWKRKLHLPENV